MKADGHGPFSYYLSIYFKGLGETMKTSSQDSWYSGLDINQTPINGNQVLKNGKNSLINTEV
jgi:hypothetical protein